jgi:hypothetical protein
MHTRTVPTLTLALSSLFVLTACPEEIDGNDDVGDTTSGTTSLDGPDDDDDDDTTGDGSEDTGTEDTGTEDTATEDTATEDTGDTSDTADTADTNGDFCATDPGWGTLAVGEPAKHIQGFDQTGEPFNMCEYGGTPIIIDVAAVWCGPCNDVSAYFAQGGADPFGGGLGDQLTTMIADGSVIWMTSLVEDANSGPATVTNAMAWDQSYPNPNIPVVVEGDISMLPNYFQLQCWPSAFIVDHEMNWMGFDDCQTWNQLVAVVQTYGN